MGANVRTIYRQFPKQPTFQRTFYITIVKAPHIYSLTQLKRFVKLCCLRTLLKPLDTIKTTTGQDRANIQQGVWRYFGWTMKHQLSATISSISSRRNSYGLLFVIFIFCNFIQQQFRAGHFSNSKNNAKPCPL